MTRDRAETVALTALAWLAGDEDLLGVFLGSTGAAPDDLRARAGDPAFLASVLEFLTMDDDWVRRCAEATGLDPTEPMAARVVLEGPAGMHWT